MLVLDRLGLRLQQLWSISPLLLLLLLLRLRLLQCHRRPQMALSLLVHNISINAEPHRNTKIQKPSSLVRNVLRWFCFFLFVCSDARSLVNSSPTLSPVTSSSHLNISASFIATTFSNTLPSVASSKRKNRSIQVEDNTHNMYCRYKCECEFAVSVFFATSAKSRSFYSRLHCSASFSVEFSFLIGNRKSACCFRTVATQPKCYFASMSIFDRSATFFSSYVLS